MAKILITGSSGGFGSLTVKALLKKGHSVVAALRDRRGRHRALTDEFGRLGAVVVEMDVTQESSVMVAVLQALEAARGLDVVIVEPGGHPTAFMDRLLRPSDTSRDASLGVLPQDAQAYQQRFEKHLEARPAQDAQQVADAIVKVIETPAGQRPFRTIVDRLGMGALLQPYNEQLEQLSASLYAASGIASMRRLKTGQPLEHYAS